MNFFKKLFGSGKKESDSPVEALLRQTIEGLIANGGFEIEYEQASQAFGHKAVGQVIACEDT